MTLLLPLLLAGMASANDAVSEGRRLYAAGQLEQAAQVLAHALRVSPANTDARWWLAHTQLAMGRLEPALRNLEKLEAVYTHDSEYLFALSEAYTRRARELSETVAALGDSSGRAHQLLAYRYKVRGDWEIAVKELRRAAALRPRGAGIHLEAAETFWEQRHYEEAGAELEAELLLSPQDFLANLRYGQLLLRRRQPDVALRHLETAARYERYPESHLLLALALEQRGDPAKSATVLSAGLSLFPDDGDLVEVRKRLLGRFPDLKNSRSAWRPDPLREAPPDRAALRQALERNPRDEDALFLLSRAYAEAGDVFFQRLEKEFPDSHRVWQIRGIQAEAAGDLQSAESCYRKVLQKQPELPGAHFALGLVLQKRGETEGSIAEYQAELRIDPQHYLAAYELGSALSRAGDPRAGLAWLKRAVEIRPALVEAKVELAKAYLTLNEFNSALPLLQEVVSKEPRHASAHYLLHRCYRALGATADAQSELAIHQRILQSGDGAAARGMSSRTETRK